MELGFSETVVTDVGINKFVAVVDLSSLVFSIMLVDLSGA